MNKGDSSRDAVREVTSNVSDYVGFVRTLDFTFKPVVHNRSWDWGGCYWPPVV